MIFTLRFKQLRIERGFSQEGIAKALDLSQSAVAKWELEKTEPTATAIQKVAEFFCVSADYLLGLEDEFGNKIYSQNMVLPPQPPNVFALARGGTEPLSAYISPEDQQAALDKARRRREENKKNRP